MAAALAFLLASLLRPDTAASYERCAGAGACGSVGRVEALPGRATLPPAAVSPPGLGVDAVRYLTVDVTFDARASSSGTLAHVLLRPAAAPQEACPPQALAAGQSASWLRRANEGAAFGGTVAVCIPVQGAYAVSRIRRATGYLPDDGMVRESPLAVEAPYIRSARAIVHSAAGSYELGAAAGGIVTCDSVECTTPVYSATATVGSTRGPYGAAVLRIGVSDGETALGIGTFDDGD